ncbi:hypothetical protein ANCCEY_15647 [Ancylostoma ceylanicum]|uniref:Uncharacterized protein n=1 Tax=Ancylostoma ceylanicum TaxID=53326 RepID=A0A0D6L3G2_9BILA|nr:hypothetical protein ANCCEY_15647 [Ancylostoma ceylanicum]
MQWVKRSEKPHLVHRWNIHGKKSMLTVFCCVDEPILWKLVPQGKSTDADYVRQELKEMALNAEQCGRKRDQIPLLSLELWLKRKQLKSEDDLKLELSAFFESKKRSFYYYGIRSLAHRWQRVIDHHGS